MNPFKRHFTFLALSLAAVMLFAGIAFSQSFEENLIKNLHWRNIGPVNMSGRVVAIDAVENDFKHVVVASASGGVYKSTNGGNTFEPIFDTYPVVSVGDVALFQPDPNIIWIASGEGTNRNSVAWGDGIYKSTDGGATFENVGLKDSHHIARLITHPTDPDIVYVAASGHLWGFTGERGLYKTTNGGRNWQKLGGGLPDDGRTGCTEIVMDPTDPNILYTAFYEKKRTAYSFDSGGPNGGIWKSTDAGRTWKKLTKGLPSGILGNIGIAVYKKDPRIVMAMVEHGFQPNSNDSDYNDMSKLGTGVYRSEDGGENWQFLNRYNNRPFYYSQIYINPLNDQRVYLQTGSFMVSEDGGKTFARGGQGTHGDYHALWLDPNDTDRYYIGNDGGSALTHDHGRNFIFFDNLVFAQYYAIGTDMRDPYYIYGGLQDNGSWGGPGRTRDSRGILSDFWYHIGGGDGFYNQVDPTDWRTLYNESQNGYINRHNVETRESVSIRPRPDTIVNYRDFITPEIEQQMEEQEYDDAFRYDWQSPILISPHNPKTIYFGSNHLFKSVNQGDTWTIISPDLSTNDPEKTDNFIGGLTKESGHAEIHCALITIAESPVTPGLIWTGTDDGNIHITLNDGVTWKDLTNNVPGIPEATWVSRINASHFDDATAYLTLDGHRSDDFNTYVFKTTDYGETWQDITGNLPENQPVYVIREDTKNQNLLFIGTEFACFYSADEGGKWTKLNLNMPTVAIHDLLIHPRDNDLIAGTHGRGIWIMDDISPLQQLTEEIMNKDAHLFENRTATKWLSIQTGGQGGHLWFGGENPPIAAAINYYLGENASGTVNFEITDITGQNIKTFEVNAEPGIGRLFWDMRFDPPALTPEQQNRQQEMAQQYGRRMQRRGSEAGPGTYKITMMYNGGTYTETITLRDDPLKK
ncbi:WD40/YVTN/BNR-like repeat-containing protein [candidate division KSB1 bacterium]